jgi:hypothetical protein
MDIRKLSAEETAFIHIRDADDSLLYETNADGAPNENNAVGITVHGPGTQTYARAKADQNKRLVALMRKKGRSNLSAEETAEESARFLADCTKSFHHIEHGEKQGYDLYLAVYSDKTIGFIGDQVSTFLGNWGNFTKGSTKT